MRNDAVSYSRYTGRSGSRRRGPAKKEKDFAGKIITQLIISGVLFAAVFVGCKLSPQMSNEVRYFLGYSYDFKSAFNEAYRYVTEQLPKDISLPALRSTPGEEGNQTPENNQSPEPSATPSVSPEPEQNQAAPQEPNGAQ